MAFLGLAHTFKRGEMIRVGLLLERLKDAPSGSRRSVASSIAAAFIGYFTWQAGRLAYDSWRFNDMSQGVVAVPLWIPQLGFVGGLAILSIAIVDEMATFQGNRPTYEKGPPTTPEELIERIASRAGG